MQQKKTEAQISKQADEFSAFVFNQIEDAIERNRETPLSRRGPILFSDDDFQGQFQLNRD
ncbi:hypothetical protein [Phyllobacterium zundukense]|uniref:Uncharacterized protein n=1 Tax=Phyllobacterium zundukense TaxID=1867719 RepID=A0ACD4D728_9HYPH|nr:hypothetical protein [Phyllobacterium zundukense]UXN61603.1 hypothetical protein N8E88_16215 [Phyllobacterium zundukense]